MQSFCPPPTLLRRTRHLFDSFILLLIVLLTGLPAATGQAPVGQRADLHDLTGPQQQALANHIKNWLIANPHIVMEHTGQACFDEFGNGIEGGAKYYTGWDGIVVQGNPASSNPFQQGQILLAPNSRIEHTVNGIRSENGGIIEANQANFYNNRLDVFIAPYSFDHASNFTGCNFINDQPLRDVEWSPIVCGEGEHHFGAYNKSRSSENHIVLSGVHGINFQSCTIDNPFKDGKIAYYSKGFVMSNSRCEITQCSIRNQRYGLLALNKVPGPGNQVTVSTSTFDKNDQGIVLFGADMSEIRGSSFIIPHKGIAGLPFLGIYSDGSAGLVIDDNNYSSATSSFTPPDYNRGAVIINTTGNAASFERRDNFSGVSVASQAQGDNSNLQIRCNTYNDFDHAIAVTSGALADQGECGFLPSSPANNTWDNPSCIGDESQIYRAPGATPFHYRAHSNQLPTCYTIGVTVDNCNSTSTATSCANGELPPCTGCEVQTIAALEAQKNSLPPGDDHIQFITHEQQLIYQQGVNERLGNGNTGLDDAITFTQNVEAVTALYPGHKAALLLLKSEREGTITTGTTAAVAAVSATDPNKKWFDLRYDLLTSSRTYNQLTATEKAMVETEAQQHTKSGAHAQAILEEAYGIPVTLYVELIDSERSSKPATTTTASNTWSIAPNPAQELAYISFTAPQTPHQSWLTVSDLNGGVYRQIDLANTFGEAQIPLSTADLPVGIYLLRLQLDNQPAEVKKLTVIR